MIFFCADTLKTGTDVSILLTLVFSLMLKLDLENEAVSADAVGFLIMLVNVLLPFGIIAYNAPTFLLGDDAVRPATRSF